MWASRPATRDAAQPNVRVRARTCACARAYVCVCAREPPSWLRRSPRPPPPAPRRWGSRPAGGGAAKAAERHESFPLLSVLYLSLSLSLSLYIYIYIYMIISCSERHTTQQGGLHRVMARAASKGPWLTVVIRVDTAVAGDGLAASGTTCEARTTRAPRSRRGETAARRGVSGGRVGDGGARLGERGAVLRGRARARWRAWPAKLVLTVKLAGGALRFSGMYWLWGKGGREQHSNKYSSEERKKGWLERFEVAKIRRQQQLALLGPQQQLALWCLTLNVKLPRYWWLLRNDPWSFSYPVRASYFWNHCKYNLSHYQC